MFRLLSILLLATALSACAYTTEKSHQTLTVRTPGAHDALCNVYVDGLRYKFFAPETRNIPKSKEDLRIDCMAPGNRRKEVFVKPIFANSAAWNVATGVVPGMMWDYASGALFSYPEEIEVNFTGAVATSQALPPQNNPDIKQPEDYDLEEFKPSQPRLNSDRYRQTTYPKRRQPYGGFDTPSPSEQYESGQSGINSGYTVPLANDYTDDPGKGDLMRVIESTGESMAAPAGNSGYTVTTINGTGTLPEQSSGGSTQNFEGSASDAAPVVLSPSVNSSGAE